MISAKSKEEWKAFYNDILRKPAYWLCIAFITLLSYLFDLTNRTVGIDDLARAKYIKDEHLMFAATRWGITLWTRLLTNSKFVPFIDKYLAIIFFIFSALLFTRIFFVYIKNNPYKLFFCTLFSCLFISYPLINEIWNYNMVNFITTGNAVLSALCILLLQHKQKIFSKTTLLCSLIMTIPMASYESSVFLYITVVITLLLMDCLVFSEKNWFTKGCRFAIPLVIALLMRYIIGFAIIRLLHLSYSPIGETTIAWLPDVSLTEQINSLFFETFINYFLKSLIYEPIAIFDISLILATISIIILSVKKKSLLSVLLYFFLVISLFLLSLIQGKDMPYRTAQTLQFFCPFSLTLTAFMISMINNKIFVNICFGLLCFLCYRQGVFMNKSLALNNQRSDYEAAIAKNIGIKLMEFDTSKPVYFVGKISLGEFVNSQNRPNLSERGGYLYKKYAETNGLLSKIYNFMKIYKSNVNSIINWNRFGFGEQKMMYEYLSYYGFDITAEDTLQAEDYEFYLHQAIDNNMKPMSVLDMGDYILVYLDEDIYVKNP
ncbi:MAG: glucosyltransferase domain-containing protein [Anaerolineaceae bacterium]|nr:glucosyltransferase domain-containing protein [Anaerolineaceae bacterium]